MRSSLSRLPRPSLLEITDAARADRARCAGTGCGLFRGWRSAAVGSSGRHVSLRIAGAD